MKASNFLKSFSSRFHLILFSFLFILPSLNVNSITVADDIIDAVSIEDDMIVISFSYEDDFDEIQVSYYEDIYNPVAEDIDDASLNGNIIEFAKPATFNDHSAFRLVFYEGSIIQDISKIHAPIFLYQDANANIVDCQLNITLSWRNYGVFSSLSPGGYDPIQLPFYQIEVLKSPYNSDHGCDFDAEEPLDNISDHPYNFAVTEESYTIVPGNYCFRIRSFNSNTGIETFSDNIVVEKGLAEPESIEVISVDIEGEEIIVSAITEDKLDDLEEFEYTLYRSYSTDNDFQEIYSIAGEDVAPSHPQVDFRDDVPDIDDGPWYYYVVTTPIGCEDVLAVSESSNEMSSLYLTVEDSEEQDQFEFDLSWEHKHDWDPYDIEIYRKLPSDDAFENIESYSGDGSSDHLDRVPIDDMGGEVKYYVKALTDNNVEVRSNIVSTSIEMISSLPNAFSPESKIDPNTFFSPRFRVIPTGYELLIYDRNGNLIYRTNEFVEGEGWDGDLPSGNPAPAGAYVYLINYNEIEKPIEGVVWLVR